MASCPKCRARYADDRTVCEVDGEALLPDSAVAQLDGELREGDLVGEYRIEKKIGEGGFGKVYAAVHPVIGKRAAIKVLNREYSSNTAVLSRFVSEARAVNQIRHRNIIDIFSFGALPSGLQYLVMELLEGETLDAYLTKHGHVAPSEALPILMRIAKAIDAAHAAGIAHRDLKPENVFLCFDDEGGVYPKLLDFGIAKLMGDTNVNHKTRTGAAMGTPLYMSPEQCRGKGVDHRTDLYSFGVMVHEILTGKLPFDGDSMMDLMFKHAQEPPPAMSSVNPALPPTLDAPVLALLAKAPEARPANLGEAVDALVQAAREAGLEVAIRKSSTLTGVSGNERRGLPSDATDPTLATVAAAPAAQTGDANTLQTLETLPATGGSKATWAIAAVAVVLGVGITFALTRPDEPAPASDASTAPATGQPAATQGDRAVAPSNPGSELGAPAASARAPKSTGSNAPPDPAPEPSLAAQPPPPQPPSRTPPLVQPPAVQPPAPPPAPAQPSPTPKPPPSDLESPF